jgi:hypothetical protein
MRKRKRLLFHKRSEKLERSFGSAQIALVAGVGIQPDECHHSRAIARGRRAVEGGLAACYQPLMVVGGEKEAAVLPIRKPLEHDIGQLPREFQMALVE